MRFISWATIERLVVLGGQEGLQVRAASLSVPLLLWFNFVFVSRRPSHVVGQANVLGDGAMFASILKLERQCYWCR